MGFSTSTPWNKLPPKVRKCVLYGYDEQVHVRYKNRYNRERSYYTTYEGVIPFIERRHSEVESECSREKFEGYMREVPCPECDGKRLKPVSLAVTLGDRSIADVACLPIDECADFLRGLELSRAREADRRAGAQGSQRPVGFPARRRPALPLARPGRRHAWPAARRSASGWRRRSGQAWSACCTCSTSRASACTNATTTGSSTRLIRLRDLGNTLIVVEHDEDTIRTADWVVDIGPGAGEHGGQVVVSGSLDDLLASEDSLTGAYLSGRRSIEVPATRRPRDPKRALVVKGAREHNLRDVDVSFPLGCFVAVTGVSGSGKSTLVNDILYAALARELYGAKTVPGRHTRIVGLDGVDKAIHVDQSPIGRTPRSNPATYTGMFDHIRKLFADTTEAKIRGYLQGRFSFNVKGGRCEACAGDGTIKIEMNFLPDVYVPCEVCHGARYNRETLDVHFKGKTISDVLDMPIEEAAEFFAAIPAIARHLTTLVEVGLGYVRLGQPAPTLSGGEAQRVKLASELQKRSTGRTVYVLDEPTTGLHFEDVRKLLGVLQSLVDKGNTVIVIEHNLDVVKTADWVIDMGPEGGSGGGLVVAEGTPEHVAGVEGSHTGVVPAARARGPSCASGREDRSHSASAQGGRSSGLGERSRRPVSAARVGRLDAVADPASYRPAAGSIPESPGVYRFRDAQGRVVYVGKAKNLRSRLNSYFADVARAAPTHPGDGAQRESRSTGPSSPPRSRRSSSNTTGSRSSTRGSTSSTATTRATRISPSPLATTCRGRWCTAARSARASVTSGPYAHAWAIRETLDLLLRVFPMRTCSSGVYRRAERTGRPCLLGHIGKCAAPCVGWVSLDEHRAIVDEFCDFMAGHPDAYLRRLERDMRDAANEQEYERAARVRDNIAALRRAMEKQTVVLADDTDADVVAFAEDQLEAAVQVFFVRAGRVRGQRGWVVEKVEDVTTADLVEHFVTQLYGEVDELVGAAADVPREVLVPVLPADIDAVTDWLRRPTRIAGRLPRSAARRQAGVDGDGRAQCGASADAAQDPARRRPHRPRPSVAGDPRRARARPSSIAHRVLRHLQPAGHRRRRVDGGLRRRLGPQERVPPVRDHVSGRGLAARRCVPACRTDRRARPRYRE